MAWWKKKANGRPPVATPRTWQPPQLDVGRAVAELDGAAEVISSTPWHSLRRLDQHHRRRSYTNPPWFSEWSHVQPGDVSVLANTSGQPLTVGALLSMHHNGRVREAAVAVLTGLDAEDVAPFLVVRIGDWVPQVQHAALHALRPWLTPANASLLIRLTPMLEPMAQEHARGSSYANELLTEIAALVTVEDLAAALVKADVRSRRWCARHLAARHSASSHLDMAMSQGDAVTARIIGEATIAERPHDRDVLDALAASKVSSLRALALHRRQVDDDPSAMVASDAALLDRAASVRFLAWRYLASHGVDVPARYRELLPDHPKALAGFAEVASRDDIDLVVPFLHHPSPSIRARAMTTYGRLMGIDAFDQLLVGLDDPNASVIRAAGRILADLPVDTDRVDRLWEHMSGQRSSAGRTAAFTVFRQQVRWVGLTMSLRAITTIDHDLQERGRELLDAVLDRWDHSFTAPRPQDIEPLRQLVAGALPSIDKPKRTEVAFAVRPFLGTLNDSGRWVIKD